jgi:hypothetical protein
LRQTSILQPVSSTAASFLLSLIVMSNPAVVFDPYAAYHRDIVQAIVDNYCIASTGKAEWYPVAFFLKDENGEVLGGLLGDIWAAGCA